MDRLKLVVKEPLLHFLAAGLGLFVLFGAVSPDGADLGDDVIVVDREALLTFIQYRAKMFEPEVAAARLEALSDADLQRLVGDYVREEALHREALALGMDANDYIIKRRLIQKVEFLAQGFADAATVIDGDGLRTFFAANKDNYYVEPSVTFTHVFFDAEARGVEAVQAAAIAKLAQLNADRVAFASAPRHGDRFLYHLNYVERTPDFVASHFGAEMAQAVFALAPGDGIWRGPYRSPYGSHLVLVAKSVPGRTPTLDEIRARVADDARRAEARERTDAAIGEIVETYNVRVVYTHDGKTMAVTGTTP